MGVIGLIAMCMCGHVLMVWVLLYRHVSDMRLKGPVGVKIVWD